MHASCISLYNMYSQNALNTLVLSRKESPFPGIGMRQGMFVTGTLHHLDVTPETHHVSLNVVTMQLYVLVDVS
jgi:hypothetical protein